MPKRVRLILIFICFLVLVAIRFFEDVLFYDPYLKFFENDYLYIDSPRRETAKLVGYTSLRYLLNSVVSLAILYFAFQSKSLVRFSSYIYFFSFLFLLAAYLYFVINPKQEQYYLFFNLRRFLIQPIILLILFPAFYYRRLKK